MIRYSHHIIASDLIWFYVSIAWATFLLLVGFEYGKQSAIPDKEFFTARALRVSPLYTRSFKAQGRFSENLGYERVKYFKSNAPEGETDAYHFQSSIFEALLGSTKYTCPLTVKYC